MKDPESPPAPPVDDHIQEHPTDPLPAAGYDFDFTDPNSKWAPYYFQLSHVLATLLVVLVFIFFNLMTPLWHSDVWGHLKIGEWIVENHRLPERELFSPFSDQSLPASNFQWLSQVIWYGTYRAGAWLAGGSAIHQTEGGVDFLRALHALAEAMKAAFLLLAFRRFSRSLPVAIGGVAVMFVFSLAPSAIQRPQVFAEVLFAAVLWLMSWPLARESFDAETAAFSWGRVFAVAALLVLWTNIHGSFLIGIALVGVLWAGRVFDSVMQRGIPATLHDAMMYRPLIALVLGVIGLSILNPHGVRAIPDVLAFAKNTNVLTMQEWRPLDFSAGGGGHWGYLALLVLIILTQIVSPHVYLPSQLVLLAVFGVAPLLQERLMTWWVMLVPVIILPAWTELTGAPSPRWSSVLSLRKTILAGGILLVGVVWSSFAQLLLGHPPVPIKLSVSQATVWPITQSLLQGEGDSELSKEDRATLEASPLYKALKTALKDYPDGKFRGRIFTPEAMGDYLVWSLPPKAPVLTYSHVHVFPPDFWEDYMEVLFAKPGWKHVLDRYQVNLIVSQVEQRTDLLEKLKDDPDWDVILDQRDEFAVPRWYRLFVAIRKKPLG